MLTQRQITSLGVNAPDYVFSADLAACFTKINAANEQFGGATQTYDQFMSMYGIPPNEQGTGRISLSEIKHAEVIFVLKPSSKYPTDRIFSMIQHIINLYLNIKVIKSPHKFQLSIQNKIQDLTQSIQYSLKSHKNRLCVFQLFSLFDQYHSPNTLQLIIIETNLHEQYSDVLGRACGDGIAIISCCNINQTITTIQRQGLFEIVIHQTLHMLGFDHCLAWKCLMNPLESGDMWLCMGCLRKLYMEIGVGSRVEAKKWVGRMVKGFRKNKWIGPAKKGRKILTALTSMDRPIAKDSQQ